MKTLFILLDSGTAIRNILRTDVLKVLKAQGDIRIIIFSPVADDDFKKEFLAENVFIEPVPKWKPNPIVKSLRSLKKDIWADRANVFTFKQKRDKKEGRFLRRFVLKVLMNNHSVKNGDSYIESLEKLELFFTPSLAGYYFEKYKPDLIFYTTIYFKDLCIEIEAQKRRIKTVCFIHSWDNPTSKGPFQVIPDRIIVWNNILKDELMRYHDFPSEKIVISGVPQFDIYVDKAHCLSKDEFFKKWGLDTARKLITYTTGTPGMTPFDHEIVELLYEALQKNSFIYPSQLLIRLHPKDKYDYYKKFENKPHLVIQMPGKPADTNDSWNPTREDMYGLAELMRYSDVVINVASTITIDAVSFDTPVINVAFDGFQTKPYKNSCRRYYDYEHYKNIVKTDGVKIAYSKEELIDYINLYLNDPSIDAGGRKKIREEQCWKLDGNSGRRIAEYILHYLYDEPISE
jgi:hypothetical protein